MTTKQNKIYVRERENLIRAIRNVKPGKMSEEDRANWMKLMTVAKVGAEMIEVQRILKEDGA